MTNNINKASFNLSIKAKKSFELFIKGFTYAVTLLFNIKFKIPITFISKVSMNALAIINVKRIRLIPIARLRTSVVQIINVRKVSLITVLKQTGKIITIIYIRNPIGFISKARQKITTTLKTGILKITAIPSVAIFFLLGDYDPDTLGALDTSTLGELDYTT